MKNSIKISLIAVLLLSSVGLYASEGDFSFSVKRVDEKTVTFISNETQVVDVALYTENNEVLYEKKTNVIKGTSKTYNLNALPDGNYTFKMQTDLQLIEYKIQLKEGKTLVSEPVFTNLLQPVLTAKNRVVTLSLENAPEGAIEIEILDQYNNQMYNRTFEGKGSLLKKFDVLRGDTRELTFIVRAADQVFSERVQVY